MLQEDLRSCVDRILRERLGERILPFDFEGKRYWLKQPEFHVKGRLLTKLIKTHPKEAFELEIKKFEILNAANLPVARLVLKGENFFVLEDGGEPLDAVFWVQKDENERTRLIYKYAHALADIHAQNFIHGRPALRDVVIKNDDIKFIDFENGEIKGDIIWLKARDFLLLVYDLCREGLSENLVRAAIDAYSQNGGESTVKEAWKRALKLRPIYYFLKLIPPKFKDLEAGVRTFELCLKIIKER